MATFKPEMAGMFEVRSRQVQDAPFAIANAAQVLSHQHAKSINKRMKTIYSQSCAT